MAQRWNGWCKQLGLASWLAMGGAIAFSGDCTFAQPIPDGTLPNNSVVTPHPDNTSVITGGTQVGTNLFHSFEQFSVPTGSRAFFNNALTIENIISRVTGGSVSHIDGTLKANGTANVFLLNPNGIIFGSNARLNIGGSFLASTASSLLFADGTQFSATDPQATSLLTISVPIGLQFGETAGEIQVQRSRLKIDPGKTLALIGGEIVLQGRDRPAKKPNLAAPGGRIELGSVADVGQVSLYQSGDDWVLGYDRINTFKNVRLEDAAFIDVSGKGGGDIQIRGARLELYQRSRIFADTQGTEAGGEVLVRMAEAITLSEGSRITTDVLKTATGTGGNIRIETRQLKVQDGALVRAGIEMNGEGQGGNVSVTASDSVELFGSGSSLSTLSQGNGSAGNLTVDTRRLSVQNGAQVYAGTLRKGQGGKLSVTAESIELIGRSSDGQFPSGLFTQAEAGSSGNAGDLIINTRQLIVGNGARITANTLGRGKGGDIRVNASDSVNIFGVGSNRFASGLFTRTSGEGNGGNIFVDTSSFQVADNGVVDARTLGTGTGGNITINANTFEAINGGQIFTNASMGSRGSAGNITVIVTDIITISGMAPFKRIVRIGDQLVEDESATSGLSVLSRGSGNAGKIDVTTRSLRLDNRGELTAESNSSEGGNISLQVQDLLQLRGRSRISTTAGLAGAGGNGGNINIDAKFILAVPNENSDITANAFEGRGGNININTQGIYGLQYRDNQTDLSDITASSELGVAGIVNINNPEVDPNQGLVNLLVLPETTEVVQACTPSGNNPSEFTITGRGGLPPTPQETLNNEPIGVDWVTLPNQSSTISKQPDLAPVSEQIIEAQGWIIDTDGKVLLVAQADSSTAYHSGQKSVNCHGD